MGLYSLTESPDCATSWSAQPPEPTHAQHPSPAQSEASRLNGARSAGPASAAGKARSALNGVRHGLCGRTFFLLPDEDPAEFLRHEALWLAAWRPRDLHEHQAAEAAVRCMWREEHADRLEAVVLSDLFAAGQLADPAEAGPPRRWRSRRWARCCAIAAGSSVSIGPPCRRWNPCVSAGSPAPRPRDRTNPSRPCPRSLRYRLPSPMPRSPSPPFAPRPRQRPQHCAANPSPPPP